jgi:hypothetical protein
MLVAALADAANRQFAMIAVEQIAMYRPRPGRRSAAALLPITVYPLRVVLVNLADHPIMDGAYRGRAIDLERVGSFEDCGGCSGESAPSERLRERLGPSATHLLLKLGSRRAPLPTGHDRRPWRAELTQDNGNVAVAIVRRSQPKARKRSSRDLKRDDQPLLVDVPIDVVNV